MTASWVDGAAGSAYDADNLPYGVFVREGEEPRVGARIGEYVLDLAPVAATEIMGWLSGLPATANSGDIYATLD